jgi:hypothetical protein
MTLSQIACIHSGSQKAKRNYADLAGYYEFVPTEQCDYNLE